MKEGIELILPELMKALECFHKSNLMEAQIFYSDAADVMHVNFAPIPADTHKRGPEGIVWRYANNDLVGISVREFSKRKQETPKSKPAWPRVINLFSGVPVRGSSPIFLRQNGEKISQSPIKNCSPFSVISFWLNSVLRGHSPLSSAWNSGVYRFYIL